MVEVRKTGVLNSEAKPSEMAASRPISRARLNRARDVSFARDLTFRGGSAEAPLCLMFSDSEGKAVSNTKKMREGMSQKTICIAVVPTISILSGEWLNTRVDQVM